MLSVKSEKKHVLLSTNIHLSNMLYRCEVLGWSHEALVIEYNILNNDLFGEINQRTNIIKRFYALCILSMAYISLQHKIGTIRRD